MAVGAVVSGSGGGGRGRRRWQRQAAVAGGREGSGGDDRELILSGRHYVKETQPHPLKEDIANQCMVHIPEYKRERAEQHPHRTCDH